jgi:hypothetical protein
VLHKIVSLHLLAAGASAVLLFSCSADFNSEDEDDTFFRNITLQTEYM